MKPALSTGVLWSLDELSAMQATALLASAQRVARRHGPGDALGGRHVATLCGAAAGPSSDAFAAAALALGARVTRVHPVVSAGRRDEDLRDAAPWLGRLYDAIGCDGIGEAAMQDLAREAGVPVYNDLAEPAHPTRLLADVLAMQQHAGGAVSALRLCVIEGGGGDPRWGRDWARLAALTGFEVHVGTCHCEGGCEQAACRAFVGGTDFVCDARRVGSGQPPALLARPLHGRAPRSLETVRRLHHHHVVQALLSVAWD